MRRLKTAPARVTQREKKERKRVWRWGLYNDSDQLSVAGDIADGSTHDIRPTTAAAAAAAVCTACHVAFDPRVVPPIPLSSQARLQHQVTMPHVQSPSKRNAMQDHSI